ncbi:MAG: glycosyltransferase family 4 protein [Planctomycetota bacterium]|jgi:glycosyltransferase involved in cell wall biosynthesis
MINTRDAAVPPDDAARAAAAATGRRPRVLLLAEAANPEWVSVPLEGWSHGRALCELVDGHLVTQVRNREAILRAGLEEGRDFTAIDSERVAGPMHRLANALRGGKGRGWTTMMAFSAIPYYYYERLVWRRFGPELRRGAFDLVHRLTPLSPTVPSLLAARCRRHGVPFVVGPLNGGVPWPRAFGGARRAEREWLSYVRSLHRWMPGYRSMRKHASAILVGSIDTWEQMEARDRDRCVYIPENGIDPARFGVRRTRRAGRPLRLAFLGRLVPYKGADLLIQAAAPLVRAGDAVVRIYGSGPEEDRLAALAATEGISDGVEFCGWLDAARVPEALADCDLFVFPSIREFGGAVVLEAMAVGLVPVVVRYGGPAELVTPETGFAVEPGNAEEIVERVRAQLQRLVQHPEEIERRVEPARRRVRAQFTWAAKARQVRQVYEWVLGRRAGKPDFGMPLDDGDGAPRPDR